jgi:probable O-glycosylation ligase (exosortase A-associated)
MAGSFVACIPAIFFTYSRGAFVGLVALAACMLLQSKQKLLLIPVLVLTLLFGVVVAPQKWRDRISETTNIQEASAQSRINAWTFCWNLVKVYPLMGGGFEPFTPSLFDKYAPNPKDVHASHSIYFGVLAEHGFVGFFLYFLLVLYCFVSSRRILKLARIHGDEESAHWVHMLQYSLICFLTSGAFLGRAYFDFYFTIVACIAILKQVCREEWAASADAEEGLEEDELPAIPLSNYAGV